MLDLFTIFSKGGIVLWCFQGTSQLFTPSVNALIKTVILQERGGNNCFSHEGLTLQYKLDNEFELIFVVAYQNILKLAYVDKFLDSIHLEFRDRYKNDLQQKHYYKTFQFEECFEKILQSTEKMAHDEETIPKKMRSFEESLKSKKTVGSMIESRKDINEEKIRESKKAAKKKGNASNETNLEMPKSKPIVNGSPSAHVNSEDKSSIDIEKNRQKMMEKMMQGGKSKKPDKGKSPQAQQQQQKGKQARIWENSGSSKDSSTLDFSKKDDSSEINRNEDITTPETRSLVGTRQGELPGMDVESDDEDDMDYEEEQQTKKAHSSNNKKAAKPQRFGVFSAFKGLVGSKSITAADMVPVLEKLKDHMIAKNVAAEISEKLCESVSEKLEGKVLGTFSSIASTVKSTLHDALVQLLQPRKSINILRNVMEAQKQRRPFVITFCGVNGVGKSTNLAKIAFWLIENNFRVLIAACDTFRAGAVEQLRTHTCHLNALHPREKHNNSLMVQLYEKGYGKDAAGIAMEAIKYAQDMHVDVALIDTAGRMQDNEPLMRALAKLIKVNQPDLVLFVGEALVGNEAVDQLVKFNQALADHSSQDNPHLIDGIVLTKFDTIDDKVGAAISMTYITGQPIVFVGTGQTYTDLKNLNAKAVVQALMK